MLVYPLYFFVLFAFEISQPSATRLTMTLPFFAGFLLRPHRAVFYKSHFQEDLCACQNVDVSQNTRPLEAADAAEAKLLCSISIMIDFIFSLGLYSFLFSFFLLLGARFDRRCLGIIRFRCIELPRQCRQTWPNWLWLLRSLTLGAAAKLQQFVCLIKLSPKQRPQPTHNHHYRNVIKPNERALFNFKQRTNRASSSAFAFEFSFSSSFWVSSLGFLSQRKQKRQQLPNNLIQTKALRWVWLPLAGDGWNGCRILGQPK